MVSDPDLICALGVLGATAALAMGSITGRPPRRVNGMRVPLGLPRFLSEAGLGCLDRVARALIGLGLSANAITITCVVVAGVAGLLLSLGHFGLAAVAMVVASLGDALDGIVARKSGTASVGGALLDASVDRYEEFFFLSGLAVYFRGSIWTLVLVLGALAGSFMVSYGSAKAEAIGAAVPPGAMRRAERAACLCAAATLTTPFAWLAHRSALPEWAGQLPMLFALGLVAIVANVSAIRRLTALARGRLVALPRDRVAAEEAVASADDSGESTGVVAAAGHAVRAP